MRTFVAVDLSEEIRQSLFAVAENVRQLRLDGRPTRLDGLHLTLKFLGEIAEDRVEQIRCSLEEVYHDLCAFQVQVEGVGVFPHLARPRVLWVGIRRSEELKELQGRVEAGLEALGFSREGRDFTPHLTLMRLKSTNGLDRLAGFVRENSKIELGVLEVTAFHLYQSILRPDGAQYQKLLTFELPA